MTRKIASRTIRGSLPLEFTSTLADDVPLRVKVKAGVLFTCLNPAVSFAEPFSLVQKFQQDLPAKPDVPNVRQRYALEAHTSSVLSGHHV